ncbi:MAG: hypothetical protein J1E41_00125 [Ruminococcus sp.]|nr:hypothetical protein [Ruminococcus sp.]
MKILKKFTTSVLIISLLLSCLCLTPAFSAGKLSYEFKGDEKDRAGFAEGEITLSSVPSGEYNLYWANDKNALDGFYEIATLKVPDDASFSFKDHNAIPADATKLIACSGNNTSVNSADAVFDIPKNKQLKYKSKDANYTFMNYSDIHIDRAKSKYYKFSELHFKKALETAANRKADFIITAGDNVTNAEGPGAEFDKYQEILADSDYTGYIYEGSGNHELRTGNKETLLNTFISATGLNGDEETISKNKPYYTFKEPKTGDLFIFMSLEYLYSPDEGDEFSSEQLDWLEKLLEKNYGKNRNIYLIQHALIEGYGAGDDEDNYYTVPLNPEYESTIRFRDIISKYPELIWISGHTHIALKYGYNYSNMNDTSCNMIHDSSVCCPTLLNYNSHNLSYAAATDEDKKDMSEGYYVQVFDDASIFYGENLYYDKIYPNSTFIVEGCRKTYDDLPKNGLRILPSKGFIFGTNDDIISYVEQVFTLPKSLNCKDVTDKDISELCEKSKKLLNDMYTFSSYDNYVNLKKAVKAASSADDKSRTYAELSSAYLEVLKYTRQGNITVYFTNTKNWENVYAKLFSSKSNNGEKGEKMTYVGEDSENNKIYKIDLNYHKYNQVIFTDGTDEHVSETQTFSGENNKLYYLNGNDPTSPYYVYVRDYEG